MRGILAAVMVALIGTGCAAEALDVSPRPEHAAAALATPARCGAVFSPDAELLDETVDGAARWSVATGCDVRVGEGGTRVSLVSEIIVDGAPYAGPGFTRWHDGAWLVEVTDARVPEVIPHELGHVLNPDGDHPHVDDAVALMGEFGGDGRITDVDLTYVCARLECTAFAPEVD